MKTEPTLSAKMYRIKMGQPDHEVEHKPQWCPQWRWNAEQRLGYGVVRAISEMRLEGHTWAFIGVQLGASRETVRGLYKHEQND